MGRGLFKSLSRTSILEDPYDEAGVYHTVYGGRGLFKSLTRTSNLEDPYDETGVYHTVYGGRSNIVTASRAPIPFAKITRRPAQLTSGGGVARELEERRTADFETESFFSLSEDAWRVSAE